MYIKNCDGYLDNLIFICTIYLLFWILRFIWTSVLNENASTIPMNYVFEYTY